MLLKATTCQNLGSVLNPQTLFIVHCSFVKSVKIVKIFDKKFVFQGFFLEFLLFLYHLKFSKTSLIRGSSVAHQTADAAGTGSNSHWGVLIDFFSLVGFRQRMCVLTYCTQIQCVCKYSISILRNTNMKKFASKR